ncbi:hypothetical protein HQ533_01015 [Candidatus Woesearchaeota archaeon]|nr:hypothetical protein [Candidatus Woesearchaeota archaeon]
MEGEITLKIFPDPSQEEVEAYIDNKQFLIRLTSFSIGALIVFLIFIFSLLAIITVQNYSLFNIMILVVLFALTIFLGYKTVISFDKGVELAIAVVTQVEDVTKEYETIEPEAKGEKVKLRIYYEFTDAKKRPQKEHFVVFMDKYRLEEMKSEIPDASNEIPVIFDYQKKKVLDIYIPRLKQYMEKI